MAVLPAQAGGLALGRRRPSGKVARTAGEILLAVVVFVLVVALTQDPSWFSRLLGNPSGTLHGLFGSGR